MGIYQYHSCFCRVSCQLRQFFITVLYSWPRVSDCFTLKCSLKKNLDFYGFLPVFFRNNIFFTCIPVIRFSCFSLQHHPWLPKCWATVAWWNLSRWDGSRKDSGGFGSDSDTYSTRCQTRCSHSSWGRRSTVGLRKQGTYVLKKHHMANICLALKPTSSLLGG